MNNATKPVTPREEIPYGVIVFVELVSAMSVSGTESSPRRSKCSISYNIITPFVHENSAPRVTG